MNYDVAIVGGGMVGATLGVALAPLDLRIALIEAIPHNAAAQPSFDERTTALSNGSRQNPGNHRRVAGAAGSRHADRQDSRLGPGPFRFRAHRCRANRASPRWVTWCPIGRWATPCGRGWRDAPA